jgi:hypothetical protein
MNSKKHTKPFGFGFSHSGSSNRSKSILDSDEQQRQKPPSLDYFSDEETQPKKRKLIKLDDNLEKKSVSSNKSDSFNMSEDYVGNLEDDRPPPPRTSTGLIHNFPYNDLISKNLY